uniref:G_PROTEIN_RECEP_F1_2 domain-containing protein n=1 Tax=Parastrongyloides trichosuri TaxID=131310 RepID=A0A0N5A2B1_PARTI
MLDAKETISMYCDTFFGILLSLFCIVFIHTRPKDWNIKEYSFILICQFVFGIINCISLVILRIHVQVFENYMIVYYEFLSTDLYDFVSNRVYFSLTMYLCHISISFPTAVMIARYIVLCRTGKINTKKLFLILLFLFSLNLLVFFSCWMITEEEISEDVIRRWAIFSNNKSIYITPYVKGIGCTVHFNTFYPIFFGIGLFFIINYIIVITLYIKYQLHMKKFGNTILESTKKMHKDFGKILYYQSIIPTILSGIPSIIYFFLVSIGVDGFTKNMGTQIIQLLNFTPAVNAALFLFLLPRHRREVKRMFKRIFFKCFKKKSNVVFTVESNCKFSFDKRKSLVNRI